MSRTPAFGSDPDRPRIPPAEPVGELVDVGVNLMDGSFDADRGAVVGRARAAGVAAMVSIASDLAEARKILVHAAGDRTVWTTAGVHPHRAAEAGSVLVDELRDLAAGGAVQAIGECGLDYFRDLSPRDVQRRVFAAQARLAAELGLPLYVHDRDAHDDAHAVLADLGSDRPPTLVHCFTGTDRALDRWIELGVSIGITGWICDERRGQALREQVARVPLDRLMLETDAPYLMPRTIRPRPKTRRNEPATLPWVARQVAACRNTDPGALAEATTANARRFFERPAD